jgi:hypothetical protein
MKLAAGIFGVAAIIVMAVAIKMYQYDSCRGDGLSAGTCWAIISR